MKFMLSFIVSVNPDSIHEDAYLSAISSTLQLLYAQPKNLIRENFIHYCLQSLRFLYHNDGEFMLFSENMKENLMLPREKRQILNKFLTHFIYRVKWGLFQGGKE